MPGKQTDGGWETVRLEVRVRLKDHAGKFMGIGVLWLLEGIERHRSISRAASEMDLSYPKALRMIKNLERGVGYEIVSRRRGGSARGGAELTPVGRDFVKRYAHMLARIDKYAVNVFEKTFGRFPGPDAAE